MKKTKALTAWQKKHYIENTSSQCPYCHSDNITGSAVEVDADSAWQEVSCTDCERSWQDIYKLVDVEEIER